MSRSAFVVLLSDTAYGRLEFTVDVDDHLAYFTTHMEVPVHQFAGCDPVCSILLRTQVIYKCRRTSGVDFCSTLETCIVLIYSRSILTLLIPPTNPLWGWAFISAHSLCKYITMNKKCFVPQGGTMPASYSSMYKVLYSVTTKIWPETFLILQSGTALNGFLCLSSLSAYVKVMPLWSTDTCSQYISNITTVIYRRTFMHLQNPCSLGLWVGRLIVAS